MTIKQPDTITMSVTQVQRQWSKALGEIQDTSAPMGPYLALTDELPDPTGLGLRTWVNDELRQDSNTCNLIFDIPFIISYISRQLTLEPGDVIATGTPSGVGLGMAPQVWLQPGDSVRIEIDGLGVLENPVAQG
jgi:2-keto-4-pentenoate hydratase/2-oxohepta-3-ene-1,7-dioic acid hydratase in catechol pathway